MTTKIFLTTIPNSYKLHKIPKIYRGGVMKGKIVLFTFLLSFILVNISPVLATLPPTEVWTQTIESGGAVKVDSKDNIVICGGNKLIKVSSTGSVIWTVDAASGGLAVDPSDNIVIAYGGSFSKYASDGTLLWEKNMTTASVSLFLK